VGAAQWGRRTWLNVEGGWDTAGRSKEVKAAADMSTWDPGERGGAGKSLSPKMNRTKWRTQNVYPWKKER